MSLPLRGKNSAEMRTLEGGFAPKPKVAPSSRLLKDVALKFDPQFKSHPSMAAEIALRFPRSRLGGRNDTPATHIFRHLPFFAGTKSSRSPPTRRGNRSGNSPNAPTNPP